MTQEPRFFLVPVGKLQTGSVEQTLRLLLDRGWYAFSERTKGLKSLVAGDQLCFYRAEAGLVAEATATSPAERRVPPFVPDPQRFRWGVPVDRVRYFFDKPIPIDAQLRSRLDAFRGRDPGRAWNWFVQGARPVSRHDFGVLTQAPGAR